MLRLKKNFRTIYQINIVINEDERGNISRTYYGRIPRAYSSDKKVN